MFKRIVYGAIMILLAAFPAQAATIVVDSLSDDGTGCTLREAIQSAQGDADSGGCLGSGTYGYDTITFDQSGTITLLGALPVIDTSLSIKGPLPAGVTIDANGGAFTVMYIYHGANPPVTVHISGVTITGSNKTGGNGGMYVGPDNTVYLSNSTVSNNVVTDVGGGIYNTGNLFLRDVVIDGNEANNGGGIYNYSNLSMNNVTVSGNTAYNFQGGGIYNYATAILEDVVLSGNSANQSGGAIFVSNVATLTMKNSSVDDNVSSIQGGGIMSFGAVTLTNVTISGNRTNGWGGGISIDNAGSTTQMNNVTITNNTADFDDAGGGDGGGIYITNGTVDLGNTLIAGNLDVSLSVVGPDCVGTVTSLDYNLIGIDAGCTINSQGANDQVGTTGSPVDPLLDILADNGGYSDTHALQAGSPAIDAGGTSCSSKDQRGYKRPVDGDGDSIKACDIGAFESYDYTRVILHHPNGGDVIPAHSSYRIEWGAPSNAATFKLKYSLNNGTTWATIANGLTGTGYVWDVPTPSKNKKKALVKVIGYKANGVKVNADRSDSTFTIEVVNLMSPNGAESYNGNDTVTIRWDTHDTKKAVAKVVLKYTKNGGKTWEKIATVVDDDPGACDWTVPVLSKTKSKCKVKVVLKDAKGNTIGADASDGYFTIVPPI